MLSDWDILDRRGPHFLGLFVFDDSGNITKYNPDFKYSVSQGINLVWYVHWVLEGDTVAVSSPAFFQRLARMLNNWEEYALESITAYCDTSHCGACSTCADRQETASKAGFPDILPDRSDRAPVATPTMTTSYILLSGPSCANTLHDLKGSWNVLDMQELPKDGLLLACNTDFATAKAGILWYAGKQEGKPDPVKVEEVDKSTWEDLYASSTFSFKVPASAS